jgi:dihydroorotase
MIDSVCSDHQPHERDAKAAPFSLTAAGASTLDLLLPLLLDLVRRDELPLWAAVAAVTSRPAQILGLDAGSLKAGAPADITVVDPERPFRVTPEGILSNGKNTPFMGRTLHGKVTHTLLAGRLTFGGAGGGP